MFSAFVFFTNRVFWPKNGPVPRRPVNGYKTGNVEMGQTARPEPTGLSLAERLRSVLGEPVACVPGDRIHRQPTRASQTNDISGGVPRDMCKVPDRNRRAVRMGLDSCRTCDAPHHASREARGNCPEGAPFTQPRATPWDRAPESPESSAQPFP